jgi:hypothetical protein
MEIIITYENGEKVITHSNGVVQKLTVNDLESIKTNLFEQKTMIEEQINEIEKDINKLSA